ncbi:hypothetical protein BXZ70DRAFT_771665 [Cristinia sonorae]|uniref:Small ribosomal subunit protein uS5m n=1 Tax=Cristinia sonorae TaxID=1940300 RepID=A0A8K0UTQ0_9AGAR|nr:hypothetical protein BXZ70DRAFT_771665 [Cristinia sonorae]
MHKLTRQVSWASPSVLRFARQSTSIRLSSSSSTQSPQTPTSNLFAPNSNASTAKTSKTGRETKSRKPFPNLMIPDPLMDLHQSVTVPPARGSKHTSKVIVRNDPSMFNAYHDVLAATDPESYEPPAEETDGDQGASPSRYLSPEEIRGLHIYPLLTRFVTQQTGKGKVSRTAYLVVVGNGDGLVGFGEAKGHDRTEVMRKAQENAIRNMDYVDLFEKRTLWTEMDAKLGATRIILRPRPVGFGLAVNPYIHQVFKAAGVKDASAKVWGSRNPYQVIRLLVKMLHPGTAPLQMGNGIGGSGRRLESGRGMRGKADIQRERGRKLVNSYT